MEILKKRVNGDTIHCCQLEDVLQVREAKTAFPAGDEAGVLETHALGYVELSEAMGLAVGFQGI